MLRFVLGAVSGFWAGLLPVWACLLVGEAAKQPCMTHLPRSILHQQHIRAALPWRARLPYVGLWEGLSSHACLTCATGFCD